jgi:hypothetical protein
MATVTRSFEKWSQLVQRLAECELFAYLQDQLGSKKPYMMFLGDFSNSHLRYRTALALLPSWKSTGWIYPAVEAYVVLVSVVVVTTGWHEQWE